MQNQERQYFARPQPQNFIQQGPDGRLQYAPLGPLPNIPAPIQPMQQMQFFPISAPAMNPDLYETKRLRDKWAKWVKVASYLMLIVAVFDISAGLFSYATQGGEYESSHYQMKISTCDIIVKAIADIALIGVSMLGLKASRKKDSVSARKYLRALVFLLILLLLANIVYGYFIINKVKGSGHHNEEPDYMEDHEEPYDGNGLPGPSEPQEHENSHEENFESKIQGNPVAPPDQAESNLGHEGEGSDPHPEGEHGPQGEDFPAPPADSHHPPCHKPPQNSDENSENVPNVPNEENPRDHENRHHEDESNERDHKKKHHHNEEGEEENGHNEEKRDHEKKHHQGEGEKDHKKKHHHRDEKDGDEREHDNDEEKDHKNKHHSEENGVVDSNGNHSEEEREHERSHHDKNKGKNHHKGGCNKGDREKHHQSEERSESGSSQGETHTEEHEIEENEEFNDGDEHQSRHHAFKSMIVTCVAINIICTLGLCGCYIGCAKKLYKNSKKFEVLASQQVPAAQNFVQPVMSQPVMSQPVMSQPVGVQMQQFNAVPMGSMQYPSFAPVGSVVNPN